jgi:hypothetical protein
MEKWKQTEWPGPTWSDMNGIAVARYINLLELWVGRKTDDKGIPR